VLGAHQRTAAAACALAFLGCGSAHTDAATYRSIEHRAAECHRTSPGPKVSTDDAPASQALSDMRACMGLVFRNEAIEPLLSCMATAPCDSPCPAPGSLSLAPLPSHTDAGAACEEAMQRCGGKKEACRSVVSALLPLTDSVAHDIRACFLEPCERVQECVSMLPGIVGGARVADCMLAKSQQRSQ
jgi:hypothetical protein